MELKVTLAADNSLCLVLPEGRKLNVGNTTAALRFIQRILMDAAAGKRDQRGYVGEFPTQHVIEIWRKQDLAKQREAKVEEFKDLGIDIAALDISL